MNEETNYFTIIGPDGQMDWIYAETMWDGYQEAIEQFGPGATIRETWYKEWNCGREETGPCWYDKYGKHHVTDGITCDECGNSYKPGSIVEHDNGEKFCEVCA